ncbi:MAG: hypothetical protein ABSF38_12470 [Verrucomicrobiota bacterium]|jgi:hypothetical protein
MWIAELLVLPALPRPPLRATILAIGSTLLAADLASGFGLFFFKALLTFAKMKDNMLDGHCVRQGGNDI